VFDDRAARTALWLANRALAEDLQGQLDLTSAALISDAAVGRARFVSRVNAVVCGIEVCRLIVSHFGSGIQFFPVLRDGDSIASGTVLATIEGNARSILQLERTCLNFLGQLSGVSTLTAQFVRQVAGSPCEILDTRKTTPGWRALEKYAVRCGGGRNHRLGLYDGILIKDNHLAICDQLPGAEHVTVDDAVRRARDWLNKHHPPVSTHIPIEVEVTSIEQLALALTAQPDIVLLDNMALDQLTECVALRDRVAPGVKLEASGGVRLETVAAIAATGVNRISIGALTHSAPNVDIGLDWIPSQPDNTIPG
jgi:nicotinate-nucleotide pyrophosphorylase (carboxylating)